MKTTLIENFITQEECNKIIDSLPPNESISTQATPAEFGVWYKNNITDQRIAIRPITDLIDKIKKQLPDNNFVVKKMYVTKYNEGQECKLHFDPTDVTAIIPLNHDYTGGQFFINSRKINFNTGDLLLFGEKQVHSVSAIKQGVRYALSIWFKKTV